MPAAAGRVRVVCGGGCGEGREPTPSTEWGDVDTGCDSGGCTGGGCVVRDEPLPVVEAARGGVLPKAVCLTERGCGVVVESAFSVGGGDIDAFQAL